MSKLRLALLSSLSLLALCPLSAHADDLKVYSPVIEGGEKAVEANLNGDFDKNHDKNGYFSQVYAAEYGVTDHWKTELGVEVEKDSGDNMKATNLKWENIINPFNTGENWMETALYIEAEKSLQNGDPNNLEAKLLLEKSVGKFTNTANLIVGKEVGNNAASGVNGGFALKTTYHMDKAFEPGLEYYADMGKLSDLPGFDEQDHRFGPVIDGKIGKVRYNTGALVGLSQAAPDATVKLNLEYEF